MRYGFLSLLVASVALLTVQTTPAAAQGMVEYGLAVEELEAVIVNEVPEEFQDSFLALTALMDPGIETSPNYADDGGAMLAMLYHLEALESAPTGIVVNVETIGLLQQLTCHAAAEFPTEERTVTIEQALVVCGWILHT